MAWLVRYKCHQCGAVRAPGADAGWVRCEHCTALIAFDWQAWLASKAYRKFLSDSASGSMTSQWARYEQLLKEGDALHASRPDAALALYLEAAALNASLLPGIVPPEVNTNPAYRTALLTFNATFTQLQRNHSEMKALQAELMSTLATIDYRNPLPSVLKALELMIKQFTLASALGLPADPDHLPMGARLQVMKSQFAGGYVQMLSAEQQLTLLKQVYGADAVVEVGDPDADTGLGMFREWPCPSCGLWFLQSRHAHEFTCMGCMFRKPVSAADEGLTKIDTRCLSCAAPLSLEAGQSERACPYCNSWVRRARHDRSNDLDFQKELMAQVQKNVLETTGQALVIEPLPVEGKPGMPVTKENRRTLQLQGFTRGLAGYQTFAAPKKLNRLLQRTLGISTAQETTQAIEKLREQAATDGLLPAIAATLDAMTAALNP